MFDYTKCLDFNAQGDNHDVKYDDDVSWYEKLNPLKNHSCVTIIDNLDCDIEFCQENRCRCNPFLPNLLKEQGK